MIPVVDKDVVVTPGVEGGHGVGRGSEEGRGGGRGA